jgi:23S rRNA U2552 (ribose-2'-O)-methylase RlmE/FtsJ
MDIDIPKPPWQAIEFQSSPFLENASIESFLTVPFDLSWNEIPHTALTDIKQKIEPLESNHKWELLKKKTNPYELVYTQDNPDCPSSIAMVKPLSRSYFKMIEMLQVSQFFERLPKTTQKLRSSHVAEGPGGFIEAFLERAESRRIAVQKSYAITLKPNNNHVPGWRRSHQFLQRHSEVKIHYGEDGTGDIYVPENQRSFVQLHEPLRSHLFTGDGGFDFSTDYENQEKSVYPLLVSSAVIGIQVLTTDGVFILKLFDVYSSVTQFLLRCITLCFKEWCLYKPATSRPCNSERYLICRGFRRTHPIVLQTLQNLQTRYALYKTYPQVEFYSFFTEKEKAYLESHIETFGTNQKELLEKTIQLKDTPPSQYQWKDQYQKAYQWCSEFRIPANPATKAKAYP